MAGKKSTTPSMEAYGFEVEEELSTMATQCWAEGVWTGFHRTCAVCVADRFCFKSATFSFISPRANSQRKSLASLKTRM